MSEKESNYFVIVLIIGLSIGLPILFYFLYFLYVFQVFPAVMLNTIVAIIIVIAVIILISAFKDSVIFYVLH